MSWFLRTLFSAFKWTDWTPTWTNFTVSNLYEAKYIQVGDCVFFMINADGTYAAGTFNNVTFTLPVDASVSYYGVPTAAFLKDAANNVIGGCFPGNSAVGSADVFRYDFANLTSSGAAEIKASGHYRVA